MWNMNYKRFEEILLLCLAVALNVCSCAEISPIESNMTNNETIDTEDKTVLTANEISIAIPNEWYDQIIVNPEGNFYLTDQTLFGIFHADTCTENGLGWIFSICQYKKAEYEELYLQSESRQYVFAKDDSSYYCVLLPTDVQSEDQAINEFMEDIRTNELGGILNDMIDRNSLSKYKEHIVE